MSRVAEHEGLGIHHPRARVLLLQGKAWEEEFTDGILMKAPGALKREDFSHGFKAIPAERELRNSTTASLQVKPIS